MDWHARYTQQARWTQSLRSYLFNKAGMAAARRVLELGCGTGAVLADLPVKPGTAIHGLDTNLSSVRLAATGTPGANLLCADGARLPYPNACFDITFCHFVLLWASQPLNLLQEMRRVTRRGGAVLALAEPDYGGRVDFPTPLAELGQWQAQSLRDQGADPQMGRKLAGLFAQAGLKNVETGVVGGEWTAPPAPEEQAMEWEVIEADLAGKVPAAALQKMKRLEEQAWSNGERVLFVPTFFAWSRV